MLLPHTLGTKTKSVKGLSGGGSIRNMSNGNGGKVRLVSGC